MQSSCLKEAEQVCLHGFCLNSLLGVLEAQRNISKSRSTSAACRHSFVVKTSSSFFPDTQFTNHESLPSLQESFTQFIKVYPNYSETRRIDQIRAQEYYHLSLSNHVCLDYIGIGLFSHLQIQPQISPAIPIASSSSPLSQSTDFPLFSVSYKSVNLKPELLHGGQGSKLEHEIKQRIMEFFGMSQNEYCMVFTANRSSAFKLVAESYPFQSSRKLLTVYDHESEALKTMTNASEKRGAHIISAEFKWPKLRIHSVKLRKMIMRTKKKKKTRGLFVFPLQSRMTGASYSYQWMTLAQENGWHVLLDACALGPKDMDSFGLSLFRPDFLICSFYKVFGENPTGFGCLLVKKSVVPILEASVGTGIVSLLPAKQSFGIVGDSSGTDTELEQKSQLENKEEEPDTSSSFSGPVIVQHTQTQKSRTSDICKAQETGIILQPREPESPRERVEKCSGQNIELDENGGSVVECKCLDHVDSLGLMLISSRGRYLINWLVSALMKLQHPNRLDGALLVRIYGPKIKFDRGTALAFNLYDWKGEKVEPVLVQKLADRNNISLSHGFLHQICFLDKYEDQKLRVLEQKNCEEKVTGKSKIRKTEQGIAVVTVSLSFLANFEDIYRLWAFIAQFLDADFVEKERWRYTALNQKIVEV